MVYDSSSKHGYCRQTPGFTTLALLAGSDCAGSNLLTGLRLKLAVSKSRCLRSLPVRVLESSFA